MSFRKDNKKAHRWANWCNAHQEMITAAGLPLLITSSEDHWWDFLDHGHLDHHPDPMHFHFGSLTDHQRRALAKLVLEWQGAGETLMGRWAKELTGFADHL